ncbi:unnamed protein product [Sphagnum troendelagicum]|uniref:Uncharacterized protein n=1 Tax=Sphagnum troendelagicum TaxID=128251 RepID=A0ABP0UL75_9BRYO|nr:hypothetical protein BDL97_03G132100 [Sphagnum fallax]
MAAQPKTRSIRQEAGDPSLHPLQATSAANNPPNIQGGFWTKLTHCQEFLFKCQWIMICRKACNLCGKLVCNLAKSSCS